MSVQETTVHPYVQKNFLEDLLFEPSSVTQIAQKALETKQVEEKKSFTAKPLEIDPEEKEGVDPVDAEEGDLVEVTHVMPTIPSDDEEEEAPFFLTLW